MEARRAHRGEPPFFTNNLGARSVFVQQQPPHARVTLMKVAASVFPDELYAYITLEDWVFESHQRPLGL